MSEKYVLHANTRTMKKKNVARKLMREGKVPAVFYHKNDENIFLEIEIREMQKLINTEHSIIQLEIDGGKSKKDCIIKSVQFDPIKGFPIHVDFQGVVKGEKIKTDVHIVLKGTPAGIKQGGYMEHFLRTLHIECLPKDLPDNIEIDVSSLGLGQSVHVKDLQLDNLKILNDPEDIICMVEAQRTAEVEEVEAKELGEESAEPEVIKQKNVEEE
ncbi:MAG: 50S ribosomal protein L25 [Calditrichia bacterium]